MSLWLSQTTVQPETTLVTDDGDPAVLTARNDGLINSFNAVQLSAWRANVDMQYCVSQRKVIEQSMPPRVNLALSL